MLLRQRIVFRIGWYIYSVSTGSLTGKRAVMCERPQHRRVRSKRGHRSSMRRWSHAHHTQWIWYEAVQGFRGIPILLLGYVLCLGILKLCGVHVCWVNWKRVVVRLIKIVIGGQEERRVSIFHWIGCIVERGKWRCECDRVGILKLEDVSSVRGHIGENR